MTDDPPGGARFARRLTLFDATMIVVSGIIGSGIFINPYLVARRVETPFLILAVWIAGGAIALAGAFVFAELATVVPKVMMLISTAPGLMPKAWKPASPSRIDTASGATAASEMPNSGFKYLANAIATLAVAPDCTINNRAQP